MINQVLYFGTFSGYEEYYAIGESKAEVKNILWQMYINNYYGEPTGEDRETFEQEAYIREIKAGGVLGYNTRYGECYTLKKGKAEMIKTN